jgi:hypothetical protein
MRTIEKTKKKKKNNTKTYHTTQEVELSQSNSYILKISKAHLLPTYFFLNKMWETINEE